MKEFKIGSEYSVCLEVDHEHTALAVGSGSLPVFATPCMVALMEEAAAGCAEPFLDGEETTVGTLVQVSHISATPEGMEVTAAAKLVEADGRRLVFEVTAVDDIGVVGQGKHERFVVKKDKFMKKTLAKNNE